jgi:hypothetical protein
MEKKRPHLRCKQPTHWPDAATPRAFLVINDCAQAGAMAHGHGAHAPSSECTRKSKREAGELECFCSVVGEGSRVYLRPCGCSGSVRHRVQSRCMSDQARQFESPPPPPRVGRGCNGAFPIPSPSPSPSPWRAICAACYIPETSRSILKLCIAWLSGKHVYLQQKLVQNVSWRDPCRRGITHTRMHAAQLFLCGSWQLWSRDCLPVDCGGVATYDRSNSFSSVLLEHQDQNDTPPICATPEILNDDVIFAAM